LFASGFVKRIITIPGEKQEVGIFEVAKIKIGKKKSVEVEAKIDTGAYSTSIDKGLAEELGLLEKDNVLWEKMYKSSLGSQKRVVIRLIFWLRGKRVATRASVVNRSGLRKNY